MSTPIISHKATLTINGQPVEGFTEDEGFTTRAAIYKPFTISLRDLVEWDACTDGKLRFCETFDLDYFTEEPEQMDRQFPVLSVIEGKNNIADLWWLVDALLAEQHLHWEHVRPALVKTGEMLMDVLEGQMTATSMMLATVRPYMIGDENCYKDLSAETRHLVNKCVMASIASPALVEMVKHIIMSFRYKEPYLLSDVVNRCGISRADFNRIFVELFSHAA